MISDSRMERALTFLSSTDEDAALAKTNVARCEYLAKRIRARMFLLAEGPVETKKAKAEISKEVETADENLASTILAYEKLRAKRMTEELICEVWRSVNANRRQGNV